MSRPRTEWTVAPHGALTALDDGILTVVATVQMPLVKLPRRMNVVPLRDGRLLVWSAIALDEAAMRAIDAAGEPAFLVVPGDHHRLDARAWKDRYPSMRVVAPEGAREKVAEVVPVDTTSPDFGDPGVEFVTVPGTRGHEAALVVRTARGTTLVLNDLVANIRDESGFGGWLLRRMGFAGDTAHVPSPVKPKVADDVEQVRAQLLRWSELPELRRILVSHGEPIEDAPREVLRDLATKLK